MTTERPDARSARPPTFSAVPTPRSGVPTAGFGVSAIATPPPTATSLADEPEGHSRAVLIVGALLAVVAVVAALVAFRIIVPSTPTSSAGEGTADRTITEIREQPGTVVRYGDPHSYGDGLEVAVNAPQRYTPSDNATGVDAGVPVKMQVVITNRTDEAFRPNTLQVSATSAGQPATAVWDPDQGVALTGPDVSIPAGASIHFNIAFAVAEPGDVALELTPALLGYGAVDGQPS
ncbi:hypothetical protein [Cellulomonas xiejunii]|uniref:hypothetical protein n=1 Tax=Cellulomonas xiejunii TaxID=2968083 RepID=UPI001D0EE354|nr:hypothetical protein [Cellulomonas xiejunii]MCC2315033.1 hypothetical protein [Cellulomonas xiejunii]